MAEFIKICKICGRTFVAKQEKTEICYEPHILKCEVCGKEFEISRQRLLEKDCSRTCFRKCAAELRRRTNKEKYGGNAPASSEAVQEKMKATSRERYGMDFPMQNDKVKQKVKDTNRKKYGADYYAQTDEGKERYKQLIE